VLPTAQLRSMSWKTSPSTRPMSSSMYGSSEKLPVAISASRLDVLRRPTRVLVLAIETSERPTLQPNEHAIDAKTVRVALDKWP